MTAIVWVIGSLLLISSLTVGYVAMHQEVKASWRHYFPKSPTKRESAIKMSLQAKDIPSESYFTWREFVKVDGEATPRLIIPWSDPDEYENDAGGLFNTEKEANEWKNEFAPDEDWVLVFLTLSPLVIRGSK